MNFQVLPTDQQGGSDLTSSSDLFKRQSQAIRTTPKLENCAEKLKKNGCRRKIKSSKVRLVMLN